MQLVISGPFDNGPLNNLQQEKLFMTTRNVRRPAGFTLPEILVAVAMVGVLSAAVLPTVVGQFSKSEISRIVQELQSVAGATQVFRADIGRWPGALEQLVDVIALSATVSYTHLTLPT